MKTVRPIPIADHLWEALERMAAEMGTEPEAILNQAIHAWAGSRATSSPAAREPARRRRACGRSIPRAARRRGASSRRRRPSRTTWPAPSGPRPARRRSPRPGSSTSSARGGRLEKVSKDRFLIGRGKHCDLVVDSAKVSREHAAVVREADGWYLQDLGSANGTWFQRARIDRRRIEDGDEFFICSEKIRCVLR